ncbi:MAG: hypothetical protein HYX46_16390 [Betaproteobacteria bacterium]|nr:hypothetical protein [Betaproteobacteria bacterium]
MMEDQKGARRIPTASRRLTDRRIVELLYKPASTATVFAVYAEGGVTELESVEAPDGSTLVPISASNNLIRHQAVLLPERAEPYISVAHLVASMSEYLYRYVDLSDEFLHIATHYVLLTWVHDAFNELPYLRLRGDFGSGKTRALAIIGSICYRPFFASGASTVSPIFHILDSFGGTLVLDEADFRFSDEKSELVKILNNGNIRGFPVLRTAVTPKREFDPRAFQVFGPKVVAMRRAFEDPALESRFLTEEMGQRRLRADIPINLPDAQRQDAATLRNMLLMYRFENVGKLRVDDSLVDPTLSPRQNQIAAPLLALMESDRLRDEVRNTVKGFETALMRERSSTMEAAVLEIVLELRAPGNSSSVPVAEIASAFQARYSAEYERTVTNRQIGGLLRHKLGVATHKSHGVYVIPESELPKLRHIAKRYGIDRAAEESPISAEHE